MTLTRTIVILSLAAYLSPAVVLAASSASSEVYTNIQSSGGTGTQTIDIETSADGQVHTEHIERSIPAGGSELYVATSSGDGSASVSVYTRVGGSGNGATGIEAGSGTTTHQWHSNATSSIASSTEEAASSSASTSIFVHAFSGPFFSNINTFFVAIPHGMASIFFRIFSWFGR